MFSRLSREDALRASRTSTNQALLDLLNGLRSVEERVEALEQRFETLGTAAELDDDSLMETRLHVARQSAELSRLTVELRGKIVELGNKTGVVFEDDTSSPELAGDESFEDLTADSPARATTIPRSGGWQPSA